MGFTNNYTHLETVRENHYPRYLYLLQLAPDIDTCFVHVALQSYAVEQSIPISIHSSSPTRSSRSVPVGASEDR